MKRSMHEGMSRRECEHAGTSLVRDIFPNAACQLQYTQEGGQCTMQQICNLFECLHKRHTADKNLQFLWHQRMRAW